MQEDPITILIISGLTLYLAYSWYKDLKQSRLGKPNTRALPGATPCGVLPIGIGIMGVLILVTAETFAEYRLGISEQQSTITVFFLLPMIAAAFYEELIFRGFLIVQDRGRVALLTSILGFSLLFALLHPHLWTFDRDAESAVWQFWEGELVFHLTTKAFFSTTVLFINSLWFYTLRFFVLNPKRSLLPCFAAHLTSNLSVFFVKMAQGHVSAMN